MLSGSLLTSQDIPGRLEHDYSLLLRAGDGSENTDVTPPPPTHGPELIPSGKNYTEVMVSPPQRIDSPSCGRKP